MSLKPYTVQQDSYSPYFNYYPQYEKNSNTLMCNRRILLHIPDDDDDVVNMGFSLIFTYLFRVIINCFSVDQKGKAAGLLLWFACQVQKFAFDINFDWSPKTGYTLW